MSGKRKRERTEEEAETEKRTATIPDTSIAPWHCDGGQGCGRQLTQWDLTMWFHNHDIHAQSNGGAPILTTLEVMRAMGQVPTSAPPVTVPGQSRGRSESLCACTGCGRRAGRRRLMGCGKGVLCGGTPMKRSLQQWCKSCASRRKSRYVEETGYVGHCSNRGLCTPMTECDLMVWFKAHGLYHEGNGYVQNYWHEWVLGALMGGYLTDSHL